MSAHSSVALMDLVDGKPLDEQFKNLAKEFVTGKLKAPELDERIKTIMEKNISHDQTVALNQ